MVIITVYKGKLVSVVQITLAEGRDHSLPFWAAERSCLRRAIISPLEDTACAFSLIPLSDAENKHGQHITQTSHPSNATLL